MLTVPQVDVMTAEEIVAEISEAGNPRTASSGYPNPS
jgi:hypothetical protein